MAERRYYSYAIERAIKRKNVSIGRIKVIIEKSRKLNKNVLNFVVKSEECNIEIVKLLLEKGAEINPYILQDALQNKRCNLQLVKLLLDKGAQLNYWTLFDAVTSEGCNLDIVKFLLEKGAQLNTTILHGALLHGECNFEIVKLLIKKEAKITPMILCDAINSNKCNFNTLKLLLDYGAEVTYETLTCAINTEKCSFEILKLLLEQMVKPLKIIQPFVVIASEKCDKIKGIKLLLQDYIELRNCIIPRVMQRGEEYNLKFIKYLLEYAMDIDKDIFHYYKIDSSNISASKVLLQYLLLQYFETGCPRLVKVISGRLKRTRSSQKSLSHDIFFQMSDFADKTLYQEMCDFFYSLMKEFVEMINDKIKCDLSLFSCISNYRSIASDERKTICSYGNEILSRLHSNQYVYSRDLLCSTLSKYDVTQSLFELNMYVKKGISETVCDKVRLNYYTAISLKSYLSKDDIINLIIAYWDRDKGKKTKNLKRSHILVEVPNKPSMHNKRHKLS